MLLSVAALTLALLPNPAPAPQRPAVDKSPKVVLVLLDGIRWQELFRGVDPELMNKENGGVANVDALSKKYARNSQAESRKAIMPWFWSTFSEKGMVYGNRDLGSVMRVSNPHHFSYPGYSEMIVGYHDARINSNNPNPNPNPSVFEFLNNKKEFKGKVAIFGSWSVVKAMVTPERSKLPVNVAMEPMNFGKPSKVYDVLNKMKKNSFHLHPADPTDTLPFYTALEYLKLDKPRAMWLTFGETDTHAHDGRYDWYLDAMYRTDAMLGELWNTIQSIPEYKNNTTLIISVDHGRGNAPRGWMSHGSSVPGADATWAAIIGPKTPNMGEVKGGSEVFTAQVAATVAQSVGEDYKASDAKIASPLPGAIKTK